MSGYVQIKKECILSLLRNSFNSLVDEIRVSISSHANTPTYDSAHNDGDCVVTLSHIAHCCSSHGTKVGNFLVTLLQSPPKFASFPKCVLSLADQLNTPTAHL